MPAAGEAVGLGVSLLYVSLELLQLSQMAGFLKNREIFEENHKVLDLLDFSAEIERLENFLLSIPCSSLVGYIGKFGSGKSTAIYQLRKKQEADPDTQWFEFDAWKYPERKDLWEGFVLDIADQMGQLKSTKKKIDGGAGASKGVGAIAQIAQTVGGAFSGLAFLIDKFSYLFERQPIERVFELQEVLEKMLSALKKKNISIVVEDIDRSGDAGKYFLETLRQFIRTHEMGKRIIILVPIGTDVYEKDSDLRDSYFKVLDYTLFFEPHKIKYTGFIPFFDEEAFPKFIETQPNVREAPIWKVHIEEWFRIAASHLTIREIKAIIRIADLAFQQLRDKGYNPDPRVILVFALLNRLHTEGGGRWISRIGVTNPLSTQAPCSVLLQAIARNTDSAGFQRVWKKADVHLIDNKEYLIPQYQEDPYSRTINNERKFFYAVSSFYLLPFGF